MPCLPLMRVVDFAAGKRTEGSLNSAAVFCANYQTIPRSPHTRGQPPLHKRAIAAAGFPIVKAFLYHRHGRRLRFAQKSAGSADDIMTL